MHHNNLAIEKDCSWGVVEKDPVIVNLNEEEQIENIEQEVVIM